MVKLSLLAVSLVTGSVLASFSEYRRRDVVSHPMPHLRFGYALGDHSIRSREFEDNDALFGRDSVDNLETREPEFPVRGFAGAGRTLAKHVNSRNLNRAANAADKVNNAIQIASSFQKRGLEDDETLVGREISIGAILKAGRRLKSASGRVNTHKLERVAKTANRVNDGMQAVNDLQNRGLEDDDEGLVGRDLDVEEFFGREYDYVLEERDTFDDLD